MAVDKRVADSAGAGIEVKLDALQKSTEDRFQHLEEKLEKLVQLLTSKQE